MSHKIVLISNILAFGLLSACENADKGDHSGHSIRHLAESSAAPTGSQGGHGEHGGHSEQGAHQPAAADKLNASFAFALGAAKANENTPLTIQITDQDAKPVNEFEVSHEKLLHLIVVSQDLSFFNHIHPEFIGNGRFTIDTSFPTGGEYKVIADFVPKGGSGTTLSEWVKVQGEEGSHVAAKADSSLKKIVDGKEIELSLSSTKPAEDVTLTFNILDAQTKEGIRNLEPYLGAVGHVVILSADAEQYLHVHSIDEKATGPKAEFATSFPKSGTYKIWGQFQHQGKVFTVPFVVEIE